MRTEKLEAFNKWYAEHKDTTFDLQKTLYEYCAHDVTILRCCVLEFRKLVTDLTTSTATDCLGREILIPGLDPFANAITLPQLCQKIFRFLCLRENISVRIKTNVPENVVSDWVPAIYERNNTFVFSQQLSQFIMIPAERVIEKKFVSSKIAQLDPNGNITGKNYSKRSIECLEYIQHHLKNTLDKSIVVQHARCSGGERQINLNNGSTRYVDGWFSYNGKEHVIEFHGCFYHSCPTCYPYKRNFEKHPFYGIALEENYQRTIDRDKQIVASGYQLTVVWECVFNQHVLVSPHIETYVSNLDIVARIHPRDALFGGRCEAFKLYSKLDSLPDNSIIDYYDFVSLYPSVQFSKCAFPVGHYKVITCDFQPIHEYFGIAKVRVIPPFNLFIPVLPLRINKKLVFTLCRTCASNMTQSLCKCSVAERSWIGTYGTPELIEACKYGYRVDKIYEVYHYDRSECYNPLEVSSEEEGLFTKYIKIFLREKTHASGWPDYCITEEDKHEYIEKYKQQYGIDLQYDQIKVNPGKRSVSKTFLNSLWGIYCMKPNPCSTTIVGDSNVSTFIDLMSSNTKKITNFHIVNEDILHVDWQHNAEFAPPSMNRNVILGLFVTMYGRLKLNSILQKHTGGTILYCDTDSVIRENIAGVCERSDSSLLGELSNELDNNEHITEYVSTGSKTYSYCTNAERVVVKAKGFFLDNRLHNKINLKSMLQLIDTAMHKAGLMPYPKDGMTENIKINRRRIRKDKYSQQLFTQDEYKTYSFVFTKRILCSDYNTLPFGWREPDTVQHK